MDYFDNEVLENDSPVWGENEPWRMPDTYGSPRIGFYAAARATFIVLVQLAYYIFLLLAALILLSAVVETTRALLHTEKHQPQHHRNKSSDEHNRPRSRRSRSQSRPRSRSRARHTESQDKRVSGSVSDPWGEAQEAVSELRDSIKVKVEPSPSTALPGSYEFDNCDNFISNDDLRHEPTTQVQEDEHESLTVMKANQVSSYKIRTRIPTPYRSEPLQSPSNAAAGHQPTILETEPSRRRRARGGTPYPETPVNYRSRLPSPERFKSPPTQGIDVVAVGDWVHRLRPAPTILKGTSDEEDLYDGPWKILEIQRRHKVQHTPMVRKTPRTGTESLIASAKLAIPADSLLQKAIEGWVPLDQLVKVKPTLSKSLEEMSNSGAVYHDHNGEKYYSIEKIRGERSGNLKSANIPAANSPKVSRTGVKTYLVHWAGYPSEDDSWEIGHRHQEGGVPAELIDEWKRRENEWKAAQKGVKAKTQQKDVKSELIRRYYRDNIDEVDD